jgi:hypothetical protein
MSQASPELVFVGGPQKGQRAVLIKRVMVAGRLPSCDIVLTEETVSRKQMQFEMTPEGWVVESLSDRGILVNGKKYKGKQVLLDTGDVIAAGAETQMLFVGPDDDAGEAVDEYLKNHPEAAAPPPPAPPEPAQGEEAQEPATPLAVSVKPARAVAVPPVDVPAGGAKPGRKMRKYLILGGVYVGLMVALVVALSSLKKKNIGSAGEVKWLDDDTIALALREDIQRQSNADLAVERLNEALSLWGNRNFRRGNLQKCVKSFKLALAYSEKKSDFDDPVVSEQYRVARDELIALVQRIYQRALPQEKDNRWPEAVTTWDELSVHLPPDHEWDTPGYKKLVSNIMAHGAYARTRLPKK